MESAILLYKYICGKRLEEKQKINSVIHATMPSKEYKTHTLKRRKSSCYDLRSITPGVVNPKRDMRPLSEYPKHIIE